MRLDIGKVLGGVMVVAATVAIWMWPKGEPPAAEAVPIRPVRSMTVTCSERMPDLRFVGTVRAAETRELAFKQSGRIQRIPVSKAQQVAKGEKLAWLDPTDFENRLAQADAAVKRDRLTFQRKTDAAKKNAISQEEVSQSEAQLRQSEAELALAKRALEDTVLTAPFDCTVADVPASELDMAGPGSAVVVIQDMSKVKVEVVYPEATVIAAKKIKPVDGDGSGAAEISFDSFPGKSYPAKFVEYTARADARTQTYLATFVMDPPEDLLLLPGMSATLTIRGDAYRYDDVSQPSRRLCVPEAAIGADPSGGHFVWRLEPAADAGVYNARRTPVELGCADGGATVVLKGVSEGDRIATAGVSVLAEGQSVRLVEE